VAGISYSDTVIDHFQHPRNVGTLDHPDATAKAESPVCGDLMEIYMRIDGDRIEDVRFRTFGCGAAIASSSMATEMIKGKTIEEALELTDERVAEALGGLPEQKMHCSNLAASAIHQAIQEYLGDVRAQREDDSCDA
jgi:nitrogen fixation NifU-like protein